MLVVHGLENTEEKVTVKINDRKVETQKITVIVTLPL